MQPYLVFNLQVEAVLFKQLHDYKVTNRFYCSGSQLGWPTGVYDRLLWLRRLLRLLQLTVDVDVIVIIAKVESCSISLISSFHFGFDVIVIGLIFLME